MSSSDEPHIKLLISTFEKSLYDLIRGLRNHRGSENEYIRGTLRECRAEIRGADLDLKATALLKLIYLEMFGHDMSWASFHVLEVMSSTKYAQKRAGYLAAAQSFRPDTEVLMLATNLLKKDVASALAPTVSLPLLTVPHVITPSLANSLVSDILPRLSHSSPFVRKKAVATLYRFALVYPDALRLTWPKMRDLLMDDGQDTSVVAAIVNVVCELGWRRPNDFLSLAPRFFDFLVDGTNNWMAIKVIKLFASLTQSEPRLLKKLISPLTNLMHTTPAMSLLYECIDGIIEGGFLLGNAGTQEADELASLCVTKLRGMIVVDGDPNLKFVSLLAFSKILKSHFHLVTAQEDVILACIDDEDISIRLKALEVATGIVTSDNLQTLVDRLTEQLKGQRSTTRVELLATQDSNLGAQAELEYEVSGEAPSKKPKNTSWQQPLTTEYILAVGRSILAVCSKDNYANITDFEWFIEVLVCIYKFAPGNGPRGSLAPDTSKSVSQTDTVARIHDAVGRQLRNVAVRVGAVRRRAVKAAQTLMAIRKEHKLTHQYISDDDVFLECVIWIVGEFAPEVEDVQGVLHLLLNLTTDERSTHALSSCLQAIPKLLSHMESTSSMLWDQERRMSASKQVSQTITSFACLTDHPNLEVQERAVEYHELLKLIETAILGNTVADTQAPLILTRVLPQLFSGSKLNPVAPSAQSKVIIPEDLDLENPLHPELHQILQASEVSRVSYATRSRAASFYRHHWERHDTTKAYLPFSSQVQGKESDWPSGLKDDLIQRRGEHRKRHLDDPFHLENDDAVPQGSLAGQSIHHDRKKDDIDVDLIPIMSLNVETHDSLPGASNPVEESTRLRGVTVAEDETIEEQLPSMQQAGNAGLTYATLSHSQKPRQTKTPLGVRPIDLSQLSLADSNQGQDESSKETASQDLEMAKALAEINRLRLEMQRASDRIEATDGAPAEGTFVKKRPKKQARRVSDRLPKPSIDGGDSTKRKVRRKKAKTSEPVGVEPNESTEQR